MKDPSQYTMSFGDHLDELRKRLVYALLGPLPILVLCLVFGGAMLDILITPAQEQLRAAGLPARMLATGPAETFAAYLKVAIVASLLFSGPWMLYQFWLFIAPGLYQHERRFAYFLFPLSILLTLSGVLFLYYVLLPITLRFLIVFGTFLVTDPVISADLPSDIQLPNVPVLQGDPPNASAGDYWINQPLKELRFLIVPADSETGAPASIMGLALSGGGAIDQHYRIGEYINLVFTFGLILAIAFQMPVVLLLGGWVGLFDRQWLSKYRKYALLICAIAGAVLTPSDPMSMILLMVPLYLLYELGLLLMQLVPASRLVGRKEPPDAGDE